jgi:spermidine synthase
MITTDPDLVSPFVYEDDRTLSMHFDISAIQSRMRLDDPTALELDYTRMMMGCLLFCDQPTSMLMIGLGGGSLPKYCHRWLPAADITVVEINPQVIAMRETFLVPPDNRRFRVVRGDGAAFIASAATRYDVILVDGFTYEGQPEGLSTPSFYSDCRAALSDGGVLVVNLHAEDCELLVDRISAAFGGHAQATSDGSNCIVFAAHAQTMHRVRAEIRQRLATQDEVHRRTLSRSADRLIRALSPAPSSPD